MDLLLIGKKLIWTLGCEVQTPSESSLGLYLLGVESKNYMPEVHSYMPCCPEDTEAASFTFCPVFLPAVFYYLHPHDKGNPFPALSVTCFLLSTGCGA